MSPPISKTLNRNIEKTRVLHGTAATTKTILKVLSSTKGSWDVCADYTAPSVTMEIEQFKNAFADLKGRAVKIRYITEVTRENLHYCKKLTDFVTELRHLDGLKGNFGISDKGTYMATATMRVAQPITELIHSNVRGIVEQQQYVFETLWNRSIPAEQKISEIEEGTDLDIIDIIRDSKKAKDLYLSLLSNAKNEIMLVFPSVNVLSRHEKIGVMQLLTGAANDLDVKVRMLIPANSFSSNNSQISQLYGKIQDTASNIEIRYIEQISENKSTVLVADREFSLVMEIKDDLEETFEEAVGLSIYSNSGAGVLSYVSIFENLWKQSELYQQVKESNDLLKLQDKMQKEFINVAAHELRTPIQPILGLSRLLYSKIKKNDEKVDAVAEEKEQQRAMLDKQANEKQKQLEMLETIIRNANRLQRLSEDILDVTRIESQTLNLKPEIIDLHEMISSIIEDIKDQIKINYNIKLSLEQAKYTIFVQADKARLNQVISNLLDNSIKFTKEGTITVSTAVKNLQDQNQVMVTIRDTGTGIHPEILPRLFTKFATKSYQGTGLGVYISKSIVEAHGGTMWAENNVDTDKGCTFYFTLPIVIREAG